VEQQALVRTHGELSCGDIMSRDVIDIGVDGSPEQARALLLEHDIRTLPVVDGHGTLAGTVGLRELARVQHPGQLPMSPAVTARLTDPAIGLLPRLTDGLTHAVMILDNDGSVKGVVSQTDLLAALSRSLSTSRITDEVMQDGRGI
jgi:CBS domain-containing membrane protein